jgi:hypothetical protein
MKTHSWPRRESERKCLLNYPSNAHISNAGMVNFTPARSVPIPLLTFASSPTWGLHSSSRFCHWIYNSLWNTFCFVIRPIFATLDNQLPQHMSYQRPTNWDIHSWGMFNSRLLPAFLRRSFPGQIKHVAPTWWHSTSFQSASHTVLWKLLDWLWRSATLFTRLNTPRSLLVEIHEGFGTREEIADMRLTLTVHHGWCYSHME